ncbi:hypothetical protein AB1Y20_003247 [Prymnesium parvum]|uniref:serine O-acetyltransferase n=1 Tax=Prymnesium parvum TaxID=97485 RepID=A0AB34JDB1_PRYPA
MPSVLPFLPPAAVTQIPLQAAFSTLLRARSITTRALASRPSSFHSALKPWQTRAQLAGRTVRQVGSSASSLAHSMPPTQRAGVSGSMVVPPPPVPNLAKSTDSFSGAELPFEEKFRHFSFTKSTDAEVAEMSAFVFDNLYEEALQMARSPLTEEMARRCILDRTCLVDSLSTTLAAKLAPTDLPGARGRQGSQPVAPLLRCKHEGYLRDTIRAAISRRHVLRAVVSDIVKSFNVDPCADGLLQPALFFKGFHALTTYRVAHVIWNAGGPGNAAAALMLQSRAAEIFDVDIHPAAVIGNGVMFDHASGIVIGGTAVMGNDLYVLHGVTLGATGKPTGGSKRHPTIGDRVVIGAGSTILGDITVGDGCVVGANALVTKSVPAGGTVVGVNKIMQKQNETRESSAGIYGHDYRMAVRGLRKEDWAMQWVP